MLHTLAMVRFVAGPQAAFASVKKSARWKPRIIEKCLRRSIRGSVWVSMFKSF